MQLQCMREHLLHQLSQATERRSMLGKDLLDSLEGIPDSLFNRLRPCLIVSKRCPIGTIPCRKSKDESTTTRSVLYP